MQNHQRSGLLLNQGILGHQIWGNFARNQWVNWPTNGTPHSEVWGNNTNGSLTKFFVPTTAAAEYQPTNNYVDPIANPNSIAMSQPLNTSTYLAENYVCANPELYDDIEEMCDNIGLMLIPLINDTATLVNAFDSTARWENLYEIYKLLKSDTMDYSSTLAPLDSFVVANDAAEIGLLFNAENTVSSMWNKKGSDLDDEISECNAISPSNFSASNLKSVLLAAMTLKRYDRIPNSTEKANLEDLASQCPYTHGSAVHIARSLLAMFDSTFTNRLNPCEIPLEPELRREAASDNPSGKENILVSLHPNPTSGNLIFNISSESVGNLSGFDITGRKVFAQTKLWNGQSTFIFDYLPNGVYVFTFSSTNINQQWKIVISR